MCKKLPTVSAMLARINISGANSERLKTAMRKLSIKNANVQKYKIRNTFSDPLLRYLAKAFDAVFVNRTPINAAKKPSMVNEYPARIDARFFLSGNKDKDHSGLQ